MFSDFYQGLLGHDISHYSSIIAVAIGSNLCKIGKAS